MIICLLTGCNKPESVSPKSDLVNEPGITVINEVDNNILDNDVIDKEESSEPVEEVPDAPLDSDTENNTVETPSD